uniref:Uncharacterized protein n=1 Tax=Glossina austeni TaxID=7395 RepID=A0A1A9VWG1_GLOAU
MLCESYLGNFLTKGLRTNQLEVNTDERTLRPIARLKEPRELFALPKDKEHGCSQQAPRWPIECQDSSKHLKLSLEKKKAGKRIFHNETAFPRDWEARALKTFYAKLKFAQSVNILPEANSTNFADIKADINHLMD